MNVIGPLAQVISPRVARPVLFASFLTAVVAFVSVNLVDRSPLEITPNVFAEACETRAAESSIVKTACEEVPLLLDGHTSDVDKVRALRGWVSSWWPEAKSASKQVPEAYWRLSAEDLFDGGRAAVFGGPCGPAAQMLMMVYTEFGLRSWIYNFGNPSGIGTHIVTLVEVEKEIYLQDPHLNAEFLDANFHPIGLFSAVDAISPFNRSRTSAYYVMHTVNRLCLAEHPEQCQASWMSAATTTCDTVVGGFLCTFYDFEGARIFSDDGFWSNVSLYLANRELPPSLEYLLLSPINLTGPDGIAASRLSLQGKQEFTDSEVLLAHLLSVLDAGSISDS